MTRTLDDELFPHAHDLFCAETLGHLWIGHGRRDTLCAALRDQGYHLIVPEGTFYITVRSPLEDDAAFCAKLAAHDVFVLPGGMFELPGWFRISVTASDEMVERSITGLFMTQI